MSFTATMEDTIVVAPRSPLKRPRPGEETPNTSPAQDHITKSIERCSGFPTPPLTTSPGHGNRIMQRTISPAPSSSALSSVAPSTAEGAQGTPNGSAAQPPKKRRKLTVAEKEEQRKAQEAKAVERAEKKSQKDAGDVVKEEERRVKAEERRARNEEKEAKKRDVELVKQQKVEAEIKKQKVC